jgi:tetratricopeptide (TPR) repeat protein
MNIRKFATIAVLVVSSFAATNVAPTKAELDSMYDKAFREFSAANYEQALKELDAIDARQPDLAESQNLRGVIQMRQAHYDQAEAALQKALATDPKFWNARFNLAEIPFLRKDWAEARKRFEGLLQGGTSELQGEAAQLIQYKILLTYLLEGKENMVDSILAKFELTPDTPAVTYSNAAVAFQHKKENEAKDLIAGAEKKFSPQLNKLFAESFYEIGWMQKPAGQTRVALEITTAAEKAQKAKAIAAEKVDQAEQAFQQRDYTAAKRLIDEADAADPNQPATLNLKGEILLAQKDFDGAENAFKQATKIDPKFRDAQYNLAQIPFKKKEYTQARDRFKALLNNIPSAAREKDQTAQLLKFKIYLTLLLEGKDPQAQKMMEQFQFTGDTPALYYAEAAWEFKHSNAAKAKDWIDSARKIYSPALNLVFADSFYDIGWITTRVTPTATPKT